MQPAEPNDVLEDERERVPSSLAEEGVRKGDLNVGVLRDELDALLHNREQVARIAQ